MRGIVACEALYYLVERFAGDAPVRYVPAELHEFPVNVPLETDIADQVQAAVDELDGSGVDAIVVSYATTGGGLVGVRSRETPLVVSRQADCTSMVLPDGRNAFGENKATGTLYLTRGWIDCGVDSYKLYKAYRGEVDDLSERFDAAKRDHPSLRNAWSEGERFGRAATRSPSPATIDRFFHSIVRYYDTVALVDTGDFLDFHYDYAEAVTAFIERLRREHGDGRPVDLQTIEGVTERFQQLVAGDVTGSKAVDSYEPGEPIR